MGPTWHRGTSGFVQLAYNEQTGEQCAVKFIELGVQLQPVVVRELLNHRMCTLHPHIVQLKVFDLAFSPSVCDGVKWGWA